MRFLQNFDAATARIYASSEFGQIAKDNNDFLANLTNIVNGRPVNLQNMWNIFDYMTVQSIHNATFLASCPPDVLSRARALANYHESSLFSSANMSSIHNVPGQAILPTVLNSLARLANASDPLKLQSVSISYKPFLSLFNMMGLFQSDRNLSGIVNYAGSITFEVRSEGGAPYVRFNFKNGTDDAVYTPYALFGGLGDVSLAEFNSHLQPYALRTLSSWCSTCGNNSTRGCDLVTAANISSIGNGSNARTHQPVSPVGAGFIGAGVTLALALAIMALALTTGLIGFRSRRGTDVPGNKERKGI